MSPNSFPRLATRVAAHRVRLWFTSAFLPLLIFLCSPQFLSGEPLQSLSASAEPTVLPMGNANLPNVYPAPSLYVTFPPTDPKAPGYQGVQADLLNNPVVTGGAAFAVQWADIDQGPGAS